MKIFILEDNLERIEYFKKLFNNYELCIVKDISSAIYFLTINEYAVLFLDHDLEEDYLTSSNNGYELVKKIIELKLQSNSQFYIHSMNPAGANRMVNLLKDNGYKAMWHPFNLMR